MDTRSFKLYHCEALCRHPTQRVGNDLRPSRCAQIRDKPGLEDLFTRALRETAIDGHDFLAEVIRKGVAAVLVQRDRVPLEIKDCAVIVVDDTRRALGFLAARYRTDFELPIVAVGGSNGKTTTKELIASVLRQKIETVWSEASFNNDIGVPMTLLKLGKMHRAAVMEVGTNHPGELAPLVKMIQPRYGVITSIGREHLEFFKTVEEVSRRKRGGWPSCCPRLESYLSMATTNGPTRLLNGPGLKLSGSGLAKIVSGEPRK